MSKTCFALLLSILCAAISLAAQKLTYTVSFPDPASHTYSVRLQCSGWPTDTVTLCMPRWTPGYYQLLDYGKAVSGLTATGKLGNTLDVNRLNDNTWQFVARKNLAFRVEYTVKTDRQFVATSYVDADHAYLIPGASFLYAPEHLDVPVTVELETPVAWPDIATGLDPVPGHKNTFRAADFDVLYDCPILAGPLEELPAFTIQGIPHRFIGYQMGDFDKKTFMENLKKVVEAGVNIIGDIPYQQYTFIAIGPGRGGIEHANNTTVSFSGAGLDQREGQVRVLNFLAHEYFHHYNVKRIRPFELGPFDYNAANRTNLLWISEGLTVYYEYLMLKRAGFTSQEELLANFAHNIEAHENNPGREFQSLQQASYHTWSDGPFGNQGKNAGKAISYYDKGPIVGLFLDFAIRHATDNRQSLDDVMRYLYREYYQRRSRGFTEAEFQQVCESIAGVSLAQEFEYIYTTKPLDYATYLGYAGLILDQQPNGDKKKFTLKPLDSPGALQQLLLEKWSGE